MNITPGPWTTDFWRTNAKKTINIGQPAKEGGNPVIQAIATVPVNGPEYSDEEAANARAIAAVPEMIEALATLETAARRYANGLDSSAIYIMKLADKASVILKRIEG